MSALPPELEGFNGTAPLFPLPNLVLFPRVVQPLHIFEPRYREMVSDALEGNRLVAMALISPGSSDNGTPSLFPHVCLGRITGEERLDDGRFNILLQGLCRGKILEELPPDKNYRVATIQLLPDQLRPGQEIADRSFREEIIQRLEVIIQKRSDPQMLEMIRQEQIPLGVLADVLAYTSGLHPLEAHDLLAEPFVHDRAVHLLRLLGTFPPPHERKGVGPEFPPPFSLN